MSKPTNEDVRLFYLLGQMRALIGNMYSDIEAEGARTIEHKDSITVIDHLIKHLIYLEE